MSTAAAEYHDDVYEYSGESYVEAGQDPIPAPGIYKFKALNVKRKTNKDGTEASKDGWPTITVVRAELTEPMEYAGRFGVFQDIGTKPFPRRGPGGTQVGASKAADILRALDIDEAKSASGFEEVYQAAEKLLKEGQEFIVKTGLTARDSDFIKAELDKLGPDASQDARNEVFNKGTLQSKAFRNADGSYRFTAAGPSGKMLQARLTFSGYVPSDQTPELGPYKN